MSKPKGGLQKKVSSIFDGVPLDSEAVRGDIRRPENPVAPGQAGPMGSARTAPAVTPPPSLSVKPAMPPVVQPPVSRPPMPQAPAPKAAIPAAPAAWPKAPAAGPGIAQPQVEQKPKLNLAAAMASDAPVAAPQAAPKATPVKVETPSRQYTNADRLSPTPKAMPKVIVKRSPANEKRRTAIILGILGTVFVIALLYGTGVLSGKAPAQTPPSLSSEQTIATPTKIQWQRPAAPPPSRNPMRLGSAGTSATVIERPSTTENPQTFFSVTGIFVTNDSAKAIIDGRYVKVGEMHRGAKVTAITRTYVEYELNGKTNREYINARGLDAGSTEVTPDANSQTVK
jgi:hypothetical protein